MTVLTAAADAHDLLVRARALDREALTELYDLHNEGLYYYALRLCGDASLAEECVTEAFSRLMLAFREGRGPDENVKGYLYRTAHNWVIDRYRRQPFEASIDDDLDLVIADEADSPPAVLIRELSAAALRRAFARLTLDQQQVLALKFIEGWRNEDVAQALGKPLGAVKSLQHRALAALRRALDGQV